MNNTLSTFKTLGLFTIVMITVGSVDSIRNLPATAMFGSSLIFFFVLSALLFLIPTALVSAELSSAWSEKGGVYVWVREAFGECAGFMAIWLQWVENVIWYPTILSFIAGTIGFLFFPDLLDNKYFLITVIVVAFWLTTLINIFGMKISGLMANLCSLFGLLLPMTLIILLGALWCFKGNPIQIDFKWQHLLPDLSDKNMWVSLTGIILSYCGIELATVHVSETRNPQKTFPRAMFLSTFIILVTLLLGSLAIAIVLPHDKINLIAGIMQAFEVFFDRYHMHWILPLVAVMLIVGGLGGINNWIIAPLRGLLVAAKDGNMPRHFQKENRYKSPISLLIYQAILVTVISAVFLLIPSVNGSYWYLTALASQLYMIMYIMMFFSVIVLRLRKKTEHRAFSVPGGMIGLFIIAGAGILACSVTIVIGFFPPSGINVGGLVFYDTILAIGLLVMLLPPLLLYFFKRPSWKTH
jgi:amino acid transporter